jgi:Peptidase family M28
MTDAELVSRGRDLVQRIARQPRFAGSEQEAEARRICATELERAGLTCVERPFEYSEWPGRWGIPLTGAVQVATILIATRTAMIWGPLAALIVEAILYIALFLVSADIKRRWIRGLPISRATSINLEAKRGNPSVWLVAHLDSKSQTVPMLIRIASAVALAVAAALLALLLVLSMAGVREPALIAPAIGIAAIAAGAPSILCFVRNDSDGAVDNASGVAAVLLAAQSLATHADVGVLITSGEELGLAGARAWSQANTGTMTTLNCDTVDDAGSWRLMYTGRRPLRIAEASAKISERFDGLRLSRLIPGILADSIVFADRGLEAITLSKGTLATLARIHTRRDTSNVISGDGVARASVLLTALTTELV